MRLKTRCMWLAAVWAFGCGIATQAAIWIGPANGNWHTDTNWNPPDVPDSTGESAVFNTAQGGSPVSAVGFTIGSVSIEDADFELLISSVNLRLAGSSGLFNNGTVTIAPSTPCFVSSSILRFDVDADITGTGDILMLNAPCSDLQTLGSATVTNHSEHRIHGEGYVKARLNNDGVIEADQSGNSLYLRDLPKTNTAVMKATNDGTLRIEDISILNTGGTIWADGGTVWLIDAAITGGTFDRTAGSTFKLSTTSTNTNLLTDVTLTDTTSLAVRGTLTLSGSFLENRGSVVINSPAGCGVNKLIIASNLSLIGDGQVLLNGAGNCAQLLSDPGVTLLNNGDHTIRGRGNIEAVLDNAGLIEANVNGVQLRLMTNPKTSSGVMRATTGGILRIEIDISGTGGEWQADGGKLQVEAVSITTTGPIRVTDAGELEVNGGSIAGSDLTLDATGSIDINSSVVLSGDLSFAMTTESKWDWGAGAVLSMTGGVGADTQDFIAWPTLEIGGTDLGTDAAAHLGAAAGYSGNFDLTELTIGSDAHVYLVDNDDNGNRGGAFGESEALYVDTLTFADANGRLNLNGLHLYYKTLNGDPSQIIDLHVPQCLPVVPADFDDDCDVDLSDVDAFEDCAFGPAVPLDPNCDNRDLDNDSDADLSELSILQRCFSGDGIPGDPDCAN